MKGIDKEFDFGVLYHPHYALAYRKKEFDRYKQIYNVRLYHVVEGFHFPKLLEEGQLENEHFMSASGFVVGNKL